MSNIYRNPAMQKAIKLTVRSLMVKNNETYDSLCGKLEQKYGIVHNPLTLKSKINKGTIGAQLFVFILLCLNIRDLNLAELESLMLRYQSED